MSSFNVLLGFFLSGWGPEHDWSSHAADALGLMAFCYEEPGREVSFNRAIRYRVQAWV